MVRASLMAGVGLLAIAIGRHVVPFAALWVTVIVMLLADPGAIHDLGFQFSALATYGLLRLAATPRWGQGIAGWCLAPAVACAWITPWQAATFHVVPLLALPANWLVAPLPGLLTPWGLLVAGVGLVTVYSGRESTTYAPGGAVPDLP